MNKYRTIITLSLLIILIILLKSLCKPSPPVVASVKTDTVYIPVKADTFYKPKPYAVYLNHKPIGSTIIFDTLYLPEEITDSECITYYNQLKDYFSRTYIYRDSIPNKYGKIYIDDTVTQNMIKGRGLRTSLMIPEITKTITLIQPKKNEMYVGAGLLGNRNTILKGYEFNLSLKNKQDKIFGVGYEQLFNGTGFFKAEYRQKISFKK